MPRISSAGAWTSSGSAVTSPSTEAIRSRAGRKVAGRPRGPARWRRPEGSVSDLDAGLPAIGSRRTGLDRAAAGPLDRGVDLRLHVGSELALRIVEGRDADAVVGGVEEGQPALGGASGDLPDLVGDRLGQVLLSAGQDAGLRGRIRLVLVDVDADGVDAGGARGVDQAVARQTGDLEQDVDLAVLLEELGTE